MLSVYDRYFETVWRICFAELGGRQQDTEDCVSETFVRFYKSYRGDVDNDAHIKGWLIVTAQNTCRSLLKRAYRRDKSFEQQLDEGSEPADSENDYHELFEALCELPDNERRAVDLHYFFGYSGDEIADIMNAKRSTVYSWIDRGKKHLAKILKGGE